MNHAAVAGILAGVLAVSWQTGPQSPPTAPSGERIESGEIRSPAGSSISWRIRLLPLASFPDLPPSVAALLSRRDCMIPQSFEAKQPENVIHGAFRTPGSSDWAALCSSAGTTTLYVFFAGQLESPVALRTQPDSDWLGAEPGSSIYSSAWGIAVRRTAELRASPQLRHLAVIDHDAIEDARLEHSVILHYFQSGKWLNLESGN